MRESDRPIAVALELNVSRPWTCIERAIRCGIEILCQTDLGECGSAEVTRPILEEIQQFNDGKLSQYNYELKVRREARLRVSRMCRNTGRAHTTAVTSETFSANLRTLKASDAQALGTHGPRREISLDRTEELLTSIHIWVARRSLVAT